MGQVLAVQLIHHAEAEVTKHPCNGDMKIQLTSLFCPK